MSKAYSITYDLRTPGRNYNQLYEAIKGSPRWWHFLESTWLIITDETAQQVWQRIGSQIDKNDFMLIIEVRNNKEGWLPKDAWDWINQHVPS